MTSTVEKEFAVAHEFYETIVGKLTNEKGVHAETAIASAGRMAGTFLLRSFNLPIEKLDPGVAVLSDAANEKGPFLVSLLAGVLHQMKVVIDPQRLESVLDQGDQPQLSVLDTQALLESDLSRIRRHHHLGYEEAARAAAIATAIMVQKTSQVLDPHIGFKIAAYSFVEGAKTVPHRQGPSVAKERKKPWYKPW